MNEIKILEQVEALINEHHLNAKIIGIEDDGGYYRVEVEVPRCEFERIIGIDSYFEIDTVGCSVYWQQATPELVPAELGNFVLIYSQHTANDADSDVGIVSSKMVDENGDICYGCRYIQISLNNQFISSLYDFQITEENYGGYPTGFLKVLTKEEVTKHLQGQLADALEKELDGAKKKFERSTEQLPKLIDSFVDMPVIKAEKLDLNMSNCHFVSVRR